MTSPEPKPDDAAQATQAAGHPVAVIFMELNRYIKARCLGAGRHMPIAVITQNTNGIDFSDDDRVSWGSSTRLRPWMPDTSPTPDALTRALHAALDSLRPRAVAVPGWSEPIALAALLWCAKRRVPAVVMTESQERDAARSPLKEAIKARLIGLAAAALAGGAPQIDYCVKLGMPRRACFIGYDVVENAHFAHGAQHARNNADAQRQRLGLPAHGYFLASARLVERKNHLTLIDAFAQYRARLTTLTHNSTPAWDLVILGDGPMRPALEARIQQHNLTDHVHLKGHTQYPDLPAFYGLAEAFVHPSRVEQWGLVVNEAMAASLPLIVSEESGCAADLVAHGSNGFTFPANNTEALTARMLEIHQTPHAQRITMGQTSAAMIAPYTPELFGRNLLRAVEVAEERNAAGVGSITGRWIAAAMLRARPVRAYE